MFDNFKIITVTHRNLNVEEIGHFVIGHSDEQELQSRLSDLKDTFRIQELMYLSTCNRVAYILYGGILENEAHLRPFFQKINPKLSEEKLDKIGKFVSVYKGLRAVNHLYEVAGSTDSLVVGEREIFRQFREAYKRCKDFGFIGDNLRLLENTTVAAAKEIYAKTKIGEKPLSVVSLAVHAFRNKNTDKNTRILLVGAGETNTLVGKLLKKYGYNNIVLFNRSIDNARALSEKLECKAFHLSDIRDYDKGFDAMFVCTGATEAIIDLNIYKRLVRKDPAKKGIIDLSVPRNVAEEVVNCFPVDYIDIEQLRILADENLLFRKEEIKVARTLIKKRVEAFRKIYQQRQLEKVLVKVPTQIKAVKENAINNVYKKRLQEIDEDSKQLVMEMMNYMEKKCVSIPMLAAKEMSDH